MTLGTTDSRRTVLVERESEVSAVRGAVSTAAAGRGSVLLVRGPAGIGKTTVLRAVAAADGDVRVLRAGCSELEHGFEFGVVHQLFADLVSSATDAERGRWFDGRASAAYDLLMGVDLVDTSEPTFRLLHGLYWLVANLAEDRPVTLVVDDVGWADDQSRRFLAFLAGRIDALPVVLAVATRDGSGAEIEGELRRATNFRELAPAPLSEAGIEDLARAEFGVAPSAGFVSACARVTGGIPFHLVELLRELRSTSAVPDDSAAALVSEIAPGQIARVLLTHAGRCGPDGIGVCRALAVLGTAPSFGVLAEVAGLSLDRVLSSCDALADAGLLAPDALGLAHPIMRTVVLEDLGRGERERLHLRAATALREAGLANERIAVHLMEVTAGAHPWVPGVLREAARGAAARGGYRQAVRCLRRALAEPPTTAGRDPEIHLELGSAAVRCGDPIAIEALRAAVDGGHDRPWWSRAVRLLAQARAYAGELGAAADLLSAAAEELAGGGDRSDEHAEEVCDLLVDWYFYSIVTDRTGEVLGRGEDLLAELERRDSRTSGLLRGALALHGVHRNEPAVAMGALAGHARSVVLGDEIAAHRHADAVIALTLCGDLDQAEAGAERIVGFADASGDQAGIGIGRYLQGLVLLHRGRLLEAEAMAGEAMAHAREAMPLAWPSAWALLLEVLLDAGRGADAQALLAQAPRLTDALEAGPADQVRIALAAGSVLGGRDAEAVDWLTECGERLAARGGWGIAQFPWRVLAVEPLLRLGRPEEAGRLAAEHCELAERFGAPRPLAAGLRAAAAVAGRERRVAPLLRAWEVLQGTPHELDRARTAVMLGIAHRRVGENRRGKEMLAAGLELARQCGAGGLAEQASEELRAAGIRPRSAAGSGPGALTAGELRVARRAAAGLTNREIAMELYVTVKTVEVHLTSAYRKLGVTSRRELDPVLEGRVAETGSAHRSSSRPFSARRSR